MHLRTQPAYDYKRQCWVDPGPAAIALHREHLRQERDLLCSDRALEYVRAIGYPGAPVDLIRKIDSDLADLA